MEAREIVAHVCLERSDRPSVDEYAPAEAVVAAAADVRVGQDLVQRTSCCVLAEQVCTQSRLAERPASEEEERVSAEALATSD